MVTAAVRVPPPAPSTYLKVRISATPTTPGNCVGTVAIGSKLAEPWQFPFDSQFQLHFSPNSSVDRAVAITLLPLGLHSRLKVRITQEQSDTGGLQPNFSNQIQIQRDIPVSSGATINQPIFSF